MFDDIYGHENIKKGLMHATLTDRLHHALLFVGPDGIGKAMLGRAFIQAWLCEQSRPDHFVRCGECRNCKRISGNTHPDFLEIKESSASIKIDTIRELQRQLVYPPYESPNRYVMIHDIHKMQDAAANAFLKTLEEPEPRTKFILLTSQTQRLLPTIISRCQLVRFAPFSIQDISKFLIQNNISSDISTQIAALSYGSLAKALELSSGDYKADVLNTFEQIISVDSMLKAFSIASSLKGKKSLAPHVLGLLSMFLRDILVFQSSRESPLLLGYYASEIEKKSSQATYSDVIRAMDIVQETNESFLGNLNELVVWERLLVGMHGVLF